MVKWAFLLLLLLCGAWVAGSQDEDPCSPLSPAEAREHFLAGEACVNNAAPDEAPACVPQCITRVLGCTDTRKTNYNALANVDDGSCDDDPCLANPCDQHATCGHTGPGSFTCVCDEAAGYVGDGLECAEPIRACTYPSATNHDPRCTAAAVSSLVCLEDGSCTFLIAGCTSSAADNFNPAAGVNDGSCYFYGCSDILAVNYDQTANTDCVMWAPNGTCTQRQNSCVIRGCRDPDATDFNPQANEDSGLCQYIRPGCIYNNSVNYNASATVDDGSCVLLVEGCTDPASPAYDPGANVDDGSCTWIPCQPEDNDCDTNAVCHHMGPQLRSCVCAAGYVGSGTVCFEILVGCMLELAYNYNGDANVAGDCTPVVTGCMDMDALNFEPAANVDDGSCVTRSCGCTASLALNFDPTANTAADGMCEWNLCHTATRCSLNANCSYWPAAHHTGWMWNRNISACELPGSLPNLCNVLGEGFGQCQQDGIHQAAWLTSNASCAASCPAVPPCEQLGNFVACAQGGSVVCVPGHTCPEETFSCHCHDDGYIGDGHNCHPRVSGCTNGTMLNYNAAANVDDGGCIEFVHGCLNSMAQNFHLSANTDDGSCVVHPCNSTLHGCSQYATCAVTGVQEYSCECISGYGGNGSTCHQVLGCTYLDAKNFNADATMDDGNCVFYSWGCTNASAANFDPTANSDDGSCTWAVSWCLLLDACIRQRQITIPMRM
jgi:hypothetical protein